MLSLKNEITVIDWEFACLGDPAWDFAIVTRGSRKPFGVAAGLQLLLEAYNKFRSEKFSISAKDVYFYEICLAVSWYYSVKKEQPNSGEVQSNLARVGAILRRVAAL